MYRLMTKPTVQDGNQGGKQEFSWRDVNIEECHRNDGAEEQESDTMSLDI